MLVIWGKKGYPHNLTWRYVLSMALVTPTALIVRILMKEKDIVNGNGNGNEGRKQRKATSLMQQ